MRHSKRSKESKRNIDWFPVVIVGCLLYFSYLVVGMVCSYSTINQGYSAVQERLSAAQILNHGLQNERRNLESTAYIEKVAREELGMTKQGEVPYISAKR